MLSTAQARSLMSIRPIGLPKNSTLTKARLPESNMTASKPQGLLLIGNEAELSDARKRKVRAAWNRKNPSVRTAR